MNPVMNPVMNPEITYVGVDKIAEEEKRKRKIIALGTIFYSFVGLILLIAAALLSINRFFKNIPIIVTAFLATIAILLLI